jgi:hypothetical protein
MMYGPQAALIAESFPGRLRYSGASLGYQLASIIAGGPAPLIAAWLFAQRRRDRDDDGLDRQGHSRGVLRLTTRRARAAPRDNQRSPRDARDNVSLHTITATSIAAGRKAPPRSKCERRCEVKDDRRRIHRMPHRGVGPLEITGCPVSTVTVEAAYEFSRNVT